MKLLLLIALLSASLLACNKKSTTAPYTIVNKRLTFSVFTSLATPPPAGDTTWVTVQLKAFVATSAGGTPTRVWDTTLVRRRLVQYPNENQPLQIVKNYDDVDDSKEQVYAVVTVTKEGFPRSTPSTTNYSILPSYLVRTVRVEL